MLTLYSILYKPYCSSLFEFQTFSETQCFLVLSQLQLKIQIIRIDSISCVYTHVSALKGLYNDTALVSVKIKKKNKNKIISHCYPSFFWVSCMKRTYYINAFFITKTSVKQFSCNNNKIETHRKMRIPERDVTYVVLSVYLVRFIDIY